MVFWVLLFALPKAWGRWSFELCCKVPGCRGFSRVWKVYVRGEVRWRVSGVSRGDFVAPICLRWKIFLWGNCKKVWILGFRCKEA